MMNEKLSFMEKTHTWGKIWIWTATVLIICVPLAICIYYNAWPEGNNVFKGLLGVAPVYWTVGIIEIITYSPMLGTGASYLAFVTGNISAIKVPCALTAMENADVKPNTQEGEIISTIAVATSTVVTTLVITAGIILLSFAAPVLNSPVLAPGFDNILPALFGGLAVVYVGKNWKIAIAPIVFMALIFVMFPSLTSSVGILVPLGAVIAIGSARILYKKGLI